MSWRCARAREGARRAWCWVAVSAFVDSKQSRGELARLLEDASAKGSSSQYRHAGRPGLANRT
jgi:hypothetical protein